MDDLKDIECVEYVEEVGGTYLVKLKGFVSKEDLDEIESRFKRKLKSVRTDTTLYY